MRLALLALALAGAPRPSSQALARVRARFSEAIRHVSSLAGPFRAVTAPGAPSVKTVRARLKAMAGLEAAARPLLATPKAEAAHTALALGWAHLGDLEQALARKGAGQGAVRRAFREMAHTRAEDAYTLARSELPGPAPVWGAAPIARIARRGMPALQACWQEHLLGTPKAKPLRELATLTLKQGRVTAVKLAPALAGPLARLGACLKTRLLGWRPTDGAQAVELPLQFAALGPAPGNSFH